MDEEQKYFFDLILTLYMLYQFRRRVQESTQVLRELEISLRTNHIGWVSPMWVQYDCTIDRDKKLIIAHKITPKQWIQIKMWILQPPVTHLMKYSEY